MNKIFILLGLFSQLVVFSQEKKPEKTKEIQAVTIKKLSFKKMTDRYVLDVASNPAFKGTTVFDLLKQSPMLSSTDDKNLEILGKGESVIFINGRKANMDAESLSQFLKDTPSENLQKIEIITNPGSEYQVEGNSGIINIILKQKTSNGLNGNLRMANTTNYWNQSNMSVSANFRKNKLGISGSLTTSDETVVQEYLLKNGNSQGSVQTYGLINDPNKNLGGYLNIDYELNKKTNLALSWNARENKSYDSQTDFFNTQTDAAGNKTYTRTKNHENARSYNNSVNLNYEYKIDEEGSKLSANAAYLNFRRFQDAVNKTFASDANQNINMLNIQNDQSAPQLINNYSFLVDYVQKFKKDLTLSIGSNYNQTKTDNDFKNIIHNITNNSTSDRSNYFIYDEKILGMYLTLDKKFSDKFSAKIGMRYEITNSLGTSDKAKTEDLKHIQKNYNSLLPSLSLNYALSANHNLSYSFSSRVKRPSFWELNPVINYITDTNYTQNNPFVKAASNYNSELSYMYKNAYFLILNHTYVQDVLTQVPLQGLINGKNQLRYIRTNFGDQQRFSVSLGMRRSFIKEILTTNFTIGLRHNQNKGSLDTDPITGDIFPIYQNKISSTSLFVQTNNTVVLDKNKTWFLGVNYFFMGRQQVEIGSLKALMRLDLSLRKNWQDWTFALDLNDVLRTHIITVNDLQDNGNFNYLENNRYMRSIRLSLSYNFGNKKIKKIRSIETATDEIKDRTN